MKKIYTLALASILALSFSAPAEIFIVEKTNGEKIELNVDDIKEMRFKEADVETGNLAPDYVEIVDLGLSICWASCNVGADPTTGKAADMVGDYVQWGTTKQGDWFSWSPYPWGNAQTITKYNGNDNLVYLQTEDDFASQAWGTDWRMPTQEEANELIQNCTIDFEAMEGEMPGVRLTSKIPGYEDKSIFFPCTGYIQDDYNLFYNNVYLWTNTVARGFYQFAMALSLYCEGDYQGTAQVPGTYRYLGLNVRPVYKGSNKPSDPVESNEVDLGLSVNWCGYNAGASSPEQLGVYVAWGETEAKDNYSWSTYKFGTGSTSLNKYCKADKIKILEPADDAVTKIMGEEWRTPTLEEWQELLANCEVTTDEVNGVKGFRFTSTVEGYQDKSIFLPASGQKSDTGILNEYGVYMWTSTLSGTSLLTQGKAYGMESLTSTETKSADRYYGRQVRGVHAKSSAN